MDNIRKMVYAISVVLLANSVWQEDNMIVLNVAQATHYLHQELAFLIVCQMSIIRIHCQLAINVYLHVLLA